MKKMVVDKEMEMLRSIATAFPRHALQINGLSESDAEIIDLQDHFFQYLVVKTDGLQEEISEKLYEDPYLIGWMAVTVTISDLAAVGSKPLGIQLGLQLQRHYNTDWLKKFQDGINEACALYGVSILGGDTNFSETMSVSTTGIATISKGKPLMRTGMVAGELLYSTGKPGLGNAFAYARYFDNNININYKPVARLRESKLIAAFATTCIDTSDGLFPALSVLSELNKTGFQLDGALQNILHSAALNIIQTTGIPSWMLLAGPHGEYELLFTIPPGMQHAFENGCAMEKWQPFYLGKIIPGNEVHFISDGLKISCQPAVIANLFGESGGNIHLYFDLLKKQHALWCQ